MADPLERLRMEASRDNYTSMVRLAQALYGNGAGPHEVLHQCYGVQFPDEFLVIAEADPDQRDWLLGWLTLLPWKLAIPLARRRPLGAGRIHDIEREIHGRDPDLIPLVLCRSSVSHFVWGFAGSCLCYRLSELEAGRTTTYRTHSSYSNVDPRPGAAPDEIVRCGDSLLAALHQHHSDDLAGVKWAERASARQSGGGWADDEDVEMAQLVLADIEELQRRVAEHQND
ncbi:hypothetical protein E1292_24380 [Nonomuraea deserti]|uniref:Uncharacterized protein n=1 Tax=Nonomuraea deserti TaxID=1848322 RepID=A0A4R4VPM1_9ACTN|nr:hypothetical protein [Nonomuraea deserti]TDD02050.1 hypothetical protein E1292_24380 [Nonomuraea deserti]